MSTYTGRRHSPQGQYSIAGKRNSNVYTQAQHSVVLDGGADGADQPFPNKPVSHRRPLNPRIRDPLDLYDFEKITITNQPRGSLSLQEHHSYDIRETTGSQNPRKDSHSRELQMARAIHAKELMLQEKLWRVGEKIRQKIQRDSVDASAGGDRDMGQAERGQAKTRTRPTEQQRREPVGSREMIMQDRRQEDVKLLRKRPDQRNEDRMRNAHEEEKARGKRREVEVAQSQRKGRKGTREIIIHNVQEMSGELNKSRLENVKELTREKREGERDDGIWGETGVKSRDGTDKTKGREQNTNSVDDKGWTREKQYRERTYKETYSSDDERNMPQISQQKTSHRAAAENRRSTGRKLCGEPVLPPVSSPSHSTRPEQGELRPADTSLHLLPCSVCNRKFASDRLEKHIQICEKVKQSHRQVFNSYSNRTKGSALEEFWKTHSRPKTPEVTKKRNMRQNHRANTRNLHEGRLPAGTSQSKRSK